MNETFKGLKIVELASVLAGPAVGTFFSELGAHVIKVENAKTKGDVTRNWKTPKELEKDSISAYYSSVNYRKEVKFLDFNDPIHFDQLKMLIKEADVLLCNFKYRGAEKFNLRYSDVLDIKSDIIYCQLDGFTSTPSRVAFDAVLQAETGFMSMNGTKDSGPIKMPVALIDVLAGHQMKEAILIALLKKEKTGLGSNINCSLEKSALASLMNQGSNFLMNDEIPQRIGSSHPNIAPYGDTFVTSDDLHILLAVGSDSQFEKLCKILDLEDMIEDNRFSSNSLRVENRQKLCEILSVKFKTEIRRDWEEVLKKNQIPFGSVKDMKEVMNNETAKNLVLRERIDGQETKRFSSIAFTIKNR